MKKEYCPNCGDKYEAWNKFCGVCGKELPATRENRDQDILDYNTSEEEKRTLQETQEPKEFIAESRIKRTTTETASTIPIWTIVIVSTILITILFSTIQLAILPFVSQSYLPILATISFALIFLYFMPSYVAYKRDHPSRSGILLLNIFLGGTFVGWILALVWAFSDNR